MSGRRRGRENALDMVRSLGIVLALVVVVVFFAQHRAHQSEGLRVVDPREDIRAFAGHGLPVPAPPAGWRATSSHVDLGPLRLRVGYLTPSGEYAEYDGLAGEPGTFVGEVTAHATPGESVVVAGRSWTVVRGKDRAVSLVLGLPGGTVVLGSLRDSAPLPELEVLATSLRP